MKESTAGLKVMMIHAVIIMIGYVSIRYSLSLFLTTNHISVTKSFDITASAFAIQVLCGFFWSLILRESKATDHYRFVLVGGIMALVGTVFICAFYRSELALFFGISLYVVGISLYLINFQSLCNAYLVDQETRTRFNQQVFLCYNFGGFFGLIFSSWAISELSKYTASLPLQYAILYVTSSFFIIISLQILKNKKSLLQTEEALLSGKSIQAVRDDMRAFRLQSANATTQDGKRRIIKSFFTSSLVQASIGMTIGTFILLSHTLIAKILILSAFIFFFSVEIFKLRTKSAHILQIIMASSANIGYRISFVIIYITLNIFIQNHGLDKSTMPHLTYLFFYAFDPIANILMGTLVLRYLKKHLSTHAYLYLGTLVMGLSFLLPWLGQVWAHSTDSVPAISLIFAVVLFGVGEFLISPALSSQMIDLAEKPIEIRYYAGLTQLCAAAGIIIGYFIVYAMLNRDALSVYALVHTHRLLNEVKLCNVQGMILISAGALIVVFSLIIKHLKKADLSNQQKNEVGYV